MLNKSDIAKYHLASFIYVYEWVCMCRFICVCVWSKFERLLQDRKDVGDGEGAIVPKRSRENNGFCLAVQLGNYGSPWHIIICLKVFISQLSREERELLWVRSLVELWGSVGFSLQPLFPLRFSYWVYFSEPQGTWRKQRTGCALSGNREQLHVTSLFWLSGCV